MALAMAIIGGAVATTIALEASSSNGELLPSEIALASLSPEDRDRIAELDRMLIEAEAVRARSGRWPSLLDARIKMSSSSMAVNYLSSPNILVLIQEMLESSRDPAQIAKDERHRLLANGQIIHRSFWIKGGGSVAPAEGQVIDRPGEMGWREIRGWSRP